MQNKILQRRRGWCQGVKRKCNVFTRLIFDLFVFYMSYAHVICILYAYVKIDVYKFGGKKCFFLYVSNEKLDFQLSNEGYHNGTVERIQRKICKICAKYKMLHVNDFKKYILPPICCHRTTINQYEFNTFSF